MILYDSTFKAVGFNYIDSVGYQKWLNFKLQTLKYDIGHIKDVICNMIAHGSCVP